MYAPVLAPHALGAQLLSLDRYVAQKERQLCVYGKLAQI
jgi:hypothetical protein